MITVYQKLHQGLDKDNPDKIISLLLHKNICCGTKVLLMSTNNMFSWRIKKNNNTFWLKSLPYFGSELHKKWIFMFIIGEYEYLIFHFTLLLHFPWNLIKWGGVLWNLH